MKNKLEKYNCPLGLTLGVIGGKYKVLIIWYLYMNKVLRYNELQKTIKGITPKNLKTAVIYTMNVDETTFLNQYIGQNKFIL
jgi:DNA-binding HxlR family transcriptional regulator